MRHCEHVDLAAQPLPRRNRVPPPDRKGCPAIPRGQTLPGRQRAALRELLRLVADRAAAEDEVNQSRVANDAKVDTEYAKTRQGLVEKYQSLDREARSDDEQRRRMIIDDAMVGESKAKADFAAASRRIASEFDTLRETAKNEYNRARERRCEPARRRQAQGGHRAHPGAASP